MKSVIIGFSAPKNKWFPFFSWLITYGETFEHWIYTGDWDLQGFSHVYVQWEARRYEETLVYEASESTVHFLGARAAASKLRPVEKYELQTTDQRHMEMVRRCMQYAGTDYGTLNVVGIFLLKLAGVIWYLATRKRRKFRNPFADGDQTQPCLETAGIILEPHLPMDMGGSLSEQAEHWGVRQMRDFVRKIPGITRLK